MEVICLPEQAIRSIIHILKEIGKIVSIVKKLTTQMARHTFASTVLRYNDAPMEIVSQLLGHSSMKVTQES
jgi:site-specific recombinase XerD